MAEFIPDTGRIRAAYAVIEESNSDGMTSQAEASTEFDRWLAAHDRAVEVKALREAVGVLRSRERAEWEKDALRVTCAQVTAQTIGLMAEAIDHRADQIEGDTDA